MRGTTTRVDSFLAVAIENLGRNAEDHSENASANAASAKDTSSNRDNGSDCPRGPMGPRRRCSDRRREEAVEPCGTCSGHGRSASSAAQVMLVERCTRSMHFSQRLLEESTWAGRFSCSTNQPRVTEVGRRTNHAGIFLLLNEPPGQSVVVAAVGRGYYFLPSRSSNFVCTYHVIYM